jgi:hypothetical protein
MDDDLETIIRQLIERRQELPENSAEYAFVLRQLRGLGFKREGGRRDHRGVPIPGAERAGGNNDLPLRTMKLTVPFGEKRTT